MSEHEKDYDAATGVETTGHEWDGIKELNNPLPRWWLWIFYATIAWSIVYWVLMPAWPALPGLNGTNTPGIRNHSDRALVASDISELNAQRAENGEALLNASLNEIMGNQNLLQFAQANGESAFGDNCATCHGAGGQGSKGYPALVDNVWIWGGTLDDIEHTIKFGIRQEHPESRFSLMPSFGRDQLLTRDQIRDVTHYVRSKAGLEAESEASQRGFEVYDINCVSCHTAELTGDRSQGALNLVDGEWLYGSDFADVYNTIYNARNSEMPAWHERLDEATVKALAVYVHSLGGGEKAAS